MKKAFISLVSIFSVLLMMFSATGALTASAASKDVVATRVDIPEVPQYTLGAPALWEKTANGFKMAVSAERDPSTPAAIVMLPIGQLDFSGELYLHADLADGYCSGFNIFVYVVNADCTPIDTLVTPFDITSGDIVIDLKSAAQTKVGGAYMNPGYYFAVGVQLDDYSTFAGWERSVEVTNLYLANSATAKPPVVEIKTTRVDIPYVPKHTLGAPALWEKTENGFKMAVNADRDPSTQQSIVMLPLGQLDFSDKLYLHADLADGYCSGFNIFVYVVNADCTPIDTIVTPFDITSGDIVIDLKSAAQTKAGGAYMNPGYYFAVGVQLDDYNSFAGWERSVEVTNLYLANSATAKPPVVQVQSTRVTIPYAPVYTAGTAEALWERTETGFKMAVTEDHSSADHQAIVRLMLGQLDFSGEQFLHLDAAAVLTNSVWIDVFVVDANGTLIDSLVSLGWLNTDDLVINLKKAAEEKINGAYMSPGYHFALSIMMDDYNTYAGWGRTFEVTNLYLSNKASAKPPVSPAMTSLGSKIRVQYATDDTQAICFGTRINRVIENGVPYVELDSGKMELKSFGTLLMVTSKLENNEDLVFGENMPETAIHISGINLWESTDTYLIYTGVLTNIDEAHFNTAVTARPYMIVSDGDNDYTVYGQAISRSVNYTNNASSGGALKGFVKLSAADKAYYGAIKKGEPFVPQTNYADGSYSLCVANVVQYGAVGNGVADDYQAFADAIAAAAAAKGGTVFVPAGTYYISKSLKIPANVHLRGEYDTPKHTVYGGGTNIVTDYAQRGIYETPFFVLQGNSGVRNMAFYYLNQDFENPIDYSPCIGIDPTMAVFAATIQNVMVYNATYPVYLGTASGGMEVNYVWATPLKIGLLSDNDGSVANFANLYMDEKYYAECGFVGAPYNDSDRQKLHKALQNAVAYIFERHDAAFLTAVYSHGIGTGLIVRESSHPDRNTWPNSGGYGGGCSLNTFEFTDCHTGIQVEELLYVTTLSGGRIESSGATGSVGMRVTDACEGRLILNGITVDGSPDVAFENHSRGTVDLTACDLLSWENAGVSSHSGNLYLSACIFGGMGNEVLADYTGALGISGCTFASKSPKISTVGIAKDNFALLPYAVSETVQRRNDPYQYAEKIPGPAKLVIYNVLDYGVDNTGARDATSEINNVLRIAGNNGGGIVYMPVGIYRIEGTLNVPTGVELRGISEGANTDNTCHGWTRLDVYGGKGSASGDGAIILQQGAGIKGFNIYYPEQNVEGYQEGQSYTPYPYSVTAKGPNCYAMFVNGVNSYQMFDFGSAADCSNYYIYCCGGQPLRTGFFLGNNSGVGRVERCVFSLGLWAYTGLPYRVYFGAGTYDAEGMKTNALWNAYVWDLLNNCNGIVFGYNEKVYAMSNGAFAMGTVYKFVEQDGKCTEEASLFYTSADVTYDTIIIEKAKNIEMVFNIPNMWLKKDCGATVTGYVSGVNTVQWEQNKNRGVYRIDGGKMTIVGAGMSLYPIPCMFEISGGELDVVGGLLILQDIGTIVRASGGKANISGVILHDPTGATSDTKKFVTEVSGNAQVTINGCMSCKSR